MSAKISSWVLSVVGVILISVLIEIILPKGQTSKFIKSIMGLFTIFVIVCPLVSLKNNNSLDSIFGQNNIVVDADFIKSVNEQRVEEYKKTLANVLTNNGYKNVKIEIDAETENELKINRIYVDIKKIVLDENLEHIDKYTNIIAIIRSVIDISQEDIVFNE